MGHVILEEGSLNDIGDAIRSKLGVETTYLPREMAEAIMSIETKNVIEGYLYQGDFYTDAGHTDQITGEAGKLYVDLASGDMYRWDGSQYVEVSGSLELGETADTAYRGDRGKVAYDHAQAKGSQYSSGLYKIKTNSEGHVTGATAVQKSDITGLGIPAQDTTYTASNTAPLMDGAASAGSSSEYARADHRHPVDNSRASTAVATTSANGLMSSADKVKLDGIEEGANAYVLPPATTDTLGGVKPDGETIAATDGIISAVATYESDGSTAGPIAQLTAKGHAEQGSTTGKNLWNGPETVAVTEKTYLAANATLPAGSYFISANVDGSSSSYRVSPRDSSGTSIAAFAIHLLDDGRYGASFEITQEAARFYFYSTQNTGTASSATYTNIQIEVGSTATAYEPYTGGAPSPSPDYPQEIQVVRGRNLIDESSLISDHFVTLSGTVDAQSGVSCSDYIAVSPNTTFTLSNPNMNNSGKYAVVFFDASKSYVGRALGNMGGYMTVPASFVVPSNAAYLRVNVNSTSIGNGVLQLEKGSTPTPYVPYGYVGIEVRTIDRSKTTTRYINDSGTEVYDTGWRLTDYAAVIGGESYVISGVATSGNAPRSAWYDKDKNLISLFKIASGEVTAPTNARYVRLSVYGIDYDGFSFASVTPIPLPSRGWVAGLPDGTADTLTLDGAGKVTWERACEEADLGDLTWNRLSSGIFQGQQLVGSIKGKVNTVAPLLCESYIVIATDDSSDTFATRPDKRMSLQHNQTFPFVKDTAYSDAASFAASVDGVTVLYPLATSVTEEMGYVDLPEIPEGASISIPELDALNVRYHIGIMSVLAAYESRIAALEAAIAELATS